MNEVEESLKSLNNQIKIYHKNLDDVTDALRDFRYNGANLKVNSYDLILNILEQLQRYCYNKESESIDCLAEIMEKYKVVEDGK